MTDAELYDVSATLRQVHLTMKKLLGDDAFNKQVEELKPELIRLSVLFGVDIFKTGVRMANEASKEGNPAQLSMLILAVTVELRLRENVEQAIKGQ